MGAGDLLPAPNLLTGKIVAYRKQSIIYCSTTVSCKLEFVLFLSFCQDVVDLWGMCWYAVFSVCRNSIIYIHCFSKGIFSLCVNPVLTRVFNKGHSSQIQKLQCRYNMLGTRVEYFKYCFPLVALVEIKRKIHKQSDSESEKIKNDSYVKMDDKAESLLSVTFKTKQGKASTISTMTPNHLLWCVCGKWTLLHWKM